MSLSDCTQTQCIAAGAGVVGLAGFAIARKYFAGGVCKIKKDLKGQVIIITGSSAGIGKETAKVLAGMGATVILANRDEARTLPILQEIKKETKNEDVEFIRLDLADLKSIKEFVEKFKSRYQSLNILINNAGVMWIPDRKETKDGFEMQMGTNHLGHFYLTTLLLDILKKSAPSRIINVSSSGHTFTNTMGWDDLLFEKKYDMFEAYYRSKLANVVFSKELDRRLADANIKAVSLHPGAIPSELTRNLNDKLHYKILNNVIIAPLMYIFGKSLLQGAQTTLYCALEDHEKLVGGGYYTDCKLNAENPEARKAENWSRLWEESEKLIKAKAPK